MHKYNKNLYSELINKYLVLHLEINNLKKNLLYLI